jgi:hypothetical protein
MLTAYAEDRKRSAVVAAALDAMAERISDPQSRADTKALLVHLYRNGHRTAEQLKAALRPEVLAARFG